MYIHHKKNKNKTLSLVLKKKVSLFRSSHQVFKRLFLKFSKYTKESNCVGV